MLRQIAESGDRVHHDVHRPTVGGQCELHVMDDRLVFHQNIRVIQVQETTPWSDGNSG